MAFAAYYDALTENVAYESIASFVHRVLMDYNIKEGILLDAACGTGTLCECMARRGYEVIGTDLSSEMLMEAMDKKAASGLDILYLCQAMQELDLYGTVDAAVCTLDSVNHLKDETELQKAFGRISLFLNPGGVFIFDANTPYKHREILGNNTFVYDCEGIYCVWQNTFEEEDSVLIHLDLFEQDGNCYYRQEEEFREMAYSSEQIEKMLEKAGLELAACYDDYTEKKPCADTQRIVYVAVKK